MAKHVAEAILNRHILLAEAGTGTGKTFAYLVPALLHSTRILVSTGSKTLQDQLFHRDLPNVQAVLKRPFNTALLKGRSNYVCHHRLHLAEQNVSTLAPHLRTTLPLVRRFLQRTDTGDRAELNDITDENPVWPYVTSNRENCLGNECSFKEECFVLKARREALKADVIVANHHLLLADFRLKDDGMSDLLPQCDTIIVDEAHHLPELASEFFGESVSSGQWLDLCRDIIISVLTEAGDAHQLLEHTKKVQRALESLEPQIDRAFPYNGRFACSTERTPELLSFFEQFNQALHPWLSLLEEASPRSGTFSQLFKRGKTLYATLSHWIGTFPENSEGMQPFVHWLERRQRSWRIVLTPLNAGEQFHQRIQNQSADTPPQTWILTSATLAVGQDFSLYREALGLSTSDSGIEANVWESPFDYSKQSLLYLPQGLPQPNQADHAQRLIESIWPLLCASHGRALLLFTSFRAMENAWERFHQLAENTPDAQNWLPLLQGQSSKADLLEQFAKHSNPVLFGSHSFWEGVDLPGRQLSLLIIDRIPFLPPDDPITAARLSWLKHKGRDPFMEHQLPQATLTLKQGVGRLIRRESDEGVVVLGDPRLRSKYYGRRILAALPPMKVSIYEEEALEFLARL